MIRCGKVAVKPAVRWRVAGDPGRRAKLIVIVDGGKLMRVRRYQTNGFEELAMPTAAFKPAA